MYIVRRKEAYADQKNLNGFVFTGDILSQNINIFFIQYLVFKHRGKLASEVWKLCFLKRCSL